MILMSDDRLSYQS